MLGGGGHGLAGVHLRDRHQILGAVCRSMLKLVMLLAGILDHLFW